MLVTTSTLRRARVLAIAMQKGGVGKTTSAINLAFELVRLGLRVLVIDLDQQANSSRGLGVDPDNAEATMWEVLHLERDDRVALKLAIVATTWGVDVAPGALALRKLERSGLGTGGQQRLAKQLDTVSGEYDVVLIDCPPSLGELTAAALGAADEVLATVSPGTFELDALAELDDTVADAREALNPSVEIKHVLITRFDGRSMLGKNTRAMLKRDWTGEYLGTVALTVRVAEAQDQHKPVGIHAPDSTAADDYRAAAEELKRRIAG